MKKETTMLKALLARHKIRTADLAGAIIQGGGNRLGQSFSRPAISALINRGEFPRSTPEATVKQQVEDFLRGRGVAPAELNGLWAAGATANPGNNNEDETMLPKKATLSKAVRDYFNLPATLFADVVGDADMFISVALRNTRESLLEGMRNGGFKALVGESGSGKTTMLEECGECIRKSEEPLTLIIPPIVGMDTSREKGAMLKARSILNYIMDVVAPNAKRPADLTRFTAAVQHELSERSGERKYCLVIDDAHRLNYSTLCHLKDFYELKLGRKRLLSIVLLGQPALAQRLDPANPELIQISQRCEVLQLPALGADLEAYVAQRCKAVGVDAGKLIAADAYPAIRQRLSAVGRQRGREATAVDLTYALAVNNLLLAAFAVAEREKARQIDSAVIMEVK